MSERNDYESRFWRILEKNRIGDLSQYHAPHYCEEVPLYTRLSDLAFLSAGTVEETNSIVLRFALKFLRSVISYEEHDTLYFAAITIAEFAPRQPIVPSLFVWPIQFSSCTRNWR